MKRVGRIEEYVDLMAIADAIFTKKQRFAMPDGTRLRTKLFKGKLYAVDYKGIRYVEQSPDTSSSYAQQVRESGARILWVIRTHQKARDAAGAVHFVPCSDEWMGRVEDGQVFMK